MTAYLVALIEQPSGGQHWKDTEYGPTFGRLLGRYGGSMIASSAIEQVEGLALDESRAAVFQFPTMVAARGFWNDPEYQAVAPLRRQLGTFQIFLLPGNDGPPVPGN